MNLQHVNVKLFVDGELNVDLQRFIEIFHQWIIGSKVDGMLIDVADYRHVPQGPSVMLIGLEEDYGIDNTRGQYGLIYNRKAPLEGTNADRFSQALRAADRACSLLEAEIDGLTFDRGRFELYINDRALAPNNDETREFFEAELATFVREALGENNVRIEGPVDRRQRVGAVVSLSQPMQFGQLAAAD